MLETAVFGDHRWQMTWGERSALEGLLSQIKPKLALETGTAQGGSLRRIATHAERVHSFDIEPSVADLGSDLPNVEFHIGDSAELLPATLAQLAADDQHVDFALIDGDHSTEGVKRDTNAVLDSDACRTTVIVFHDAANDEVRRGLEELDLPAHPKVRVCLLDFVPGYLCKPDHVQYPLAIWNGLGLVVLGDGGGDTIVDVDHLDVPPLYRDARGLIAGAEEAPPVSHETVPGDAAGGGRRGVAIIGAAAVGAALGAVAARLAGPR